MQKRQSLNVSKDRKQKMEQGQTKIMYLFLTRGVCPTHLDSDVFILPTTLKLCEIDLEKWKASECITPFENIEQQFFQLIYHAKLASTKPSDIAEEISINLLGEACKKKRKTLKEKQRRGMRKNRDKERKRNHVVDWKRAKHKFIQREKIDRNVLQVFPVCHPKWIRWLFCLQQTDWVIHATQPCLQSQPWNRNTSQLDESIIHKQSSQSMDEQRKSTRNGVWGRSKEEGHLQGQCSDCLQMCSCKNMQTQAHRQGLDTQSQVLDLCWPPDIIKHESCPLLTR